LNVTVLTLRSNENFFPTSSQIIKHRPSRLLLSNITILKKTRHLP